MSTTVTEAGQPAAATNGAAATEVPAGDPAILGLPIFVVGSIALGLANVGYVPPAAAAAALPIILAATGLGLLVATIWAASLGQTLVDAYVADGDHAQIDGPAPIGMVVQAPARVHLPRHLQQLQSLISAPAAVGA